MPSRATQTTASISYGEIISLCAPLDVLTTRRLCNFERRSIWIAG